jgi:hypothetical protein
MILECQIQRGMSVLVRDPDIGTLVQQQPDDFNVLTSAFRGGQNQGRIAVIVSRFDIGPSGTR